jgi:3-hydroxybutyryl-CoA dehydratase
MNEYTIGDLYGMNGSRGGVTAEYSVKITDEMLDGYAKLFERISPLHTDDAYARASGFKARIVPQLLVVSQFLPMVEEHIPGKYGLGLGASELTFKNPVYAGETLTFKGVVSKISLAAKLIVIDITVTNGDGDVAVECKWKAKVLK